MVIYSVPLIFDWRLEHLGFSDVACVAECLLSVFQQLVGSARK